MRIRYYSVYFFLACLAICSSCNGIQDTEFPLNTGSMKAIATKEVTNIPVFDLIKILLESYGIDSSRVTMDSRFVDDLRMDEIDFYSFLDNVARELDIDLNHYGFSSVRDLVNTINQIIEERPITVLHTVLLGDEMLPVRISLEAAVSYSNQYRNRLRNVTNHYCDVEIQGPITDILRQNGLSTIRLEQRKTKVEIHDHSSIIWKVQIDAYYYRDDDSLEKVMSYTVSIIYDVTTSRVVIADTTDQEYDFSPSDSFALTTADVVLESGRVFFQRDDINVEMSFDLDLSASESELEMFFALVEERLHVVIPTNCYREISTFADLIDMCNLYGGENGEASLLGGTSVLPVLYSIICEQLEISAMDMNLFDSFSSLGADSFDMLVIIQGIETFYEISIPTKHASVFGHYDVMELYRYVATFPLCLQ